MASAVDYYIGDLFAFLKAHNMLKNTEVFIFPDHKLMGATSGVLEKFTTKRGLYMITTAEKKKVLQNIRQPFLQMDLGQMIVNGADIKTNATFLSSFLPKDKLDFLQNNRKNMLVLNEAALYRLTSDTTGLKAHNIQSNEIFLKSVGYKSIPEYGTSHIYIGLKPVDLKRGVNLLYLDDAGYHIYHTDTFASGPVTQALLKKMKVLLGWGKLIAVVVHDASVKKLAEHAQRLQEMGFSKLAKLAYRKPYLATVENGKISESPGTTSLQESIPIKEFPDPNIEEIKQDPMRFIAHGGGGINGDMYTNSIEALNLNYEKGFQLFEMDIIKTSDNVYVAAHDWNQWSKKTGYKGETPVSLKTFKKNPIKKYTPMDLDDINKWFKNHPDAILVTDKVNDPEDFAKVFIDKDRMIMELFSLNAAKEAKKLDIDVLLSDNVVIDQLGDHVLETLQSLNIGGIAISRKYIKDNIDMLRKLKNSGIKTYVFQLGGEFDEEYVLKNEINYIYGMYADEWDFRKKGQ